ncbi:AraC family transcriptional regulator [Chryseobacterium nematophagum]|uniref:AraC family transcriptional regulator n=1 Tax=Chryseobacterium nematophagum TaxID=2305228 RepID=A0A3M7L5R1_9FLAO|nr:AraC family transcriptional regulator [Chryseobacterium nematophagum]RMZ57927.1 AraC family transcriptional regulator [Chryseobacterium nematophagum]
MQKLSFFLLLLFCQNFYFSQSIRGFHIPDSLKDKSFEKLDIAYSSVFRIDNNKSELYANTILCKAKKLNNKNFLYDGYYKIAHIKGLKGENCHPYADTLLNITQNVTHKDYPAKAHIIKGILFNYEFKYNKALDEYIKAQELSRNKNIDQFFYIKKLIGILKTATEENEEALPLFLEYYNYQKQELNKQDKDIKSYIGSIFSVSNAYNKTKNYKLCKSYNKIGISECKKYNDYTHYPYFIISEGIADYYLKNYKAALKNLNEVEPYLLMNKDYANLSILYFYLGKINCEVQKEKKGIYYFIKSDSLSFVANDFEPIKRGGYEILIDYYKKQGDKENQLKFINKLFYADSIINNSKQYLSKEIYRKYDAPILLEEKETLIKNLNNRNILLYLFLGIGSVTIFSLIFLHRKNKITIRKYEKQADVLLKKSYENIIQPKKDLESNDDQINREGKEKKGLSDAKLQDIKTKLQQFEVDKGFLQKNITIDSLAKDLETNRGYLSKCVNELKEKNFSQYLNELRINYIVEELNKNEKIRKYTIAAIANDIGYNNSESFSNAFKKITGTLPSYYIKRLQNKN